MSTRGIVVLCCLATIVSGADYSRDYRGGLISEDLSKTAPANQVTSVPVASGCLGYRNVSQVDLSDEVPPVGDQGGQGSCCCWAFGYYHRSQLEYRERHWDLADPRHQFSPAFIYNQLNGGADRGSSFGSNAALLCEMGCASMADCPYDEDDCTSWPSESAYSHALPYRAKTWNWTSVRDTVELGSVKQLLANGSTVTLAINCYQNFMNIDQFDNIYCVADRYGPNTFGHGVTIVGYDDSLPTRDGTGAFKLVNSFGTGWGASGFWWMSYEAVMDTGLSQRFAAWLTDTVGYQPQLVARVRVEHPTRDRLGIRFSVGPAQSPLWNKQFRDWRQARVDQPFPDNNIVFDLTEGASYIAGGQADSVYFVTWDHWTDDSIGTVRYLSAQYLPWGNVHASADTPVVIPDDGTWVYSGTRIRRADYDAGPVGVICPSGIIAAESTYTPQVRVRNFGLNTISFPVRLSISAGYADSAAVSNLAPGDSAVVEFSPWTSPARGPCPVRCTTALAGDEFAENDVRCETAQVYFRDIAVVAVTNPPDTVDSGQVVSPRARVRNNSTQAETFLVTLGIPDEEYLKVSWALMLSPSSETLLAFAPWTPRLPGGHALCCSLLVVDMDSMNNTMAGSVFVRAGLAIFEGAAPEAERPAPTVVRGLLMFEPANGAGRMARGELLDISGRKVADLKPGENGVRALAPGVYFVKGQGSRGQGVGDSRVTKVVVTR